jgi:hypothetical protein
MVYDGTPELISTTNPSRIVKLDELLFDDIGML